MKAVVFDKLGGPEVLTLGDAPTPEIRPGKVLIKNHAVGINFADTLFRQGEYVMQPKFPDIPGLEASGVVEAVGEGVEDIKAGDRVAAIGIKAYAEYSLMSASQLKPRWYLVWPQLRGKVRMLNQQKTSFTD